MGRKSLVLSLALVSLFFLNGCTVRKYTVIKDRIDQDLTTGNQGFISGQVPQNEALENRKLTRQTYVTEIELGFPAKTGKVKQKSAAPGSVSVPEEPVSEVAEQTENSEEAAITETPVKMEKYTVLAGETLQKISQKLYGTTKRWHKIYEANSEALKGPNKIYPGQVINVPVEEQQMPPAHLK